MDIKDDVELKRRYRLSAIIGGAIIASIIMYAVVVEILVKTITPPAGCNIPEFLKYLPLAGAVLSLAMIWILNRKILSLPMANQLSPEQKVSVSIQRLFVVSIITYALSEVVAIYGLVIFILTGKLMDFYLAFVASLILLLIHFPTYRQWEERIKKI